MFLKHKHIVPKANIKEIIDFCNECYEDANVFTYAEDLEYGLKELVENIINQ